VAITIPALRYTSSEFAALENDRLWPRVWQLACSLDHVANPGDFHELRIGPISVIIVHGDDLELRAFQNACRHRGSALCEGTGQGLTEIRCPFHRTDGCEKCRRGGNSAPSVETPTRSGSFPCGSTSGVRWSS